MKKIFLAISMVALFAAGAAAQGVSGGLKAGVNLADLKGDDIGDTKMKVGFHFGGYANIAFSDALSLQPELLYNAIGAKADEGDEEVKLSYVSIPVMLMYSFGVVNIQAGPQFGFLAGAKDQDDNDLKDGLKGSDFGFNLGLGANFGKVNASARYCIGLSSIGDYDDSDIKNGVIQLSLGVKLFGE